jgi:hypothetical protein
MADFNNWVCKRGDGCHCATLSQAQACIDFASLRFPSELKDSDINAYAVTRWIGGTAAFDAAVGVIMAFNNESVESRIPLTDPLRDATGAFIAPRSGRVVVVGQLWSMSAGDPRVRLDHSSELGVVKNSYPNFLSVAMFKTNMRMLQVTKGDRIAFVVHQFALSVTPGQNMTEMRIYSVS